MQYILSMKRYWKQKRKKKVFCRTLSLSFCHTSFSDLVSFGRPFHAASESEEEMAAELRIPSTDNNFHGVDFILILPSQISDTLIQMGSAVLGFDLMV